MGIAINGQIPNGFAAQGRKVEGIAAGKVMYTGLIQGGLVLHFDGINNTGNGHSDTLYWENIAGTDFGTVVHGEWTENCLQNTQNTTNGLSVLTSMQYLPSSGDFTLETVVEHSVTATSNQQRYFYQGASGSSSKQAFVALIGGKVNLNIGGVQTQTDYSPVAGKQFSLVFLRRGDMFTIYVNGSVITSVTHVSAQIDATKTYLFAYRNDGYAMMGKAYAARIYNRALTETEVARNFNADKKRFNIS